MPRGARCPRSAPSARAPPAVRPGLVLRSAAPSSRTVHPVGAHWGRCAAPGRGAVLRRTARAAHRRLGTDPTPHAQAADDAHDCRTMRARRAPRTCHAHDTLAARTRRGSGTRRALGPYGMPHLGTVRHRSGRRASLEHGERMPRRGTPPHRTVRRLSARRTHQGHCGRSAPYRTPGLRTVRDASARCARSPHGALRARAVRAASAPCPSPPPATGRLPRRPPTRRANGWRKDVEKKSDGPCPFGASAGPYMDREAHEHGGRGPVIGVRPVLSGPAQGARASP
jgi:hypothetical protein